MSNHWMNYVWKHSPYKGSIRLVHLALADSAHADTGEVWPSQKTIAEKANVSRTRVTAAITKMVEDGYLTKSRGKHGSGNTYWLKWVETAPETDSDAAEADSDAGGNVADGDMERRGSRQSNVADGDVERRGSRRAMGALTEPSVDPSGEPTSFAPSGHEGGDTGDLAPKAAPAEGTHDWAVSRFGEEMTRLHFTTGFNKGILHRNFKILRDEGYSNHEIVEMVETFFLRYEHDIRAKRADTNVASMFVHKLPALRSHCDTRFHDKRAGRKTTAERSKELQDAAMRRMGLVS